MVCILKKNITLFIYYELNICLIFIAINVILIVKMKLFKKKRFCNQNFKLSTFFLYFNKNDAFRMQIKNEKK